MAKARKKTDSTRASRDGHEFHEAWVARKAMRLLLPDGDLAGMAVENLSLSDQKNASSETVQVADLVLYHGERPSFADSRRTEIVQFKYSVARKDSEFRACDAEKTVKKFATTYRDFRKRHGTKEVRDKLRFQLVTNRPVFPALTEAIRGLAERTSLTGEAKKQADRFKRASLLDDEQLAEFAGKCDVAGLAGNLGDIKKDLSNILVDWSATNDAVASSRLGKMKQMVRDKAGTEGEGRNVITRMDVLAALGIASEKDLLPCSSKLPEVGQIVEREKLAEVVALVPGLARPLLVHAAGGMGKTVFMRSLAEKLKDGHETVFFDCFAGGAYRSPADSRHLPRRGLTHIANTLAHKGLCDPMLPENPDLQSLLGTFRRRLEQSVGTLAKASPERKLLLFLDAIDNAEVGAQARREDCFPTLLLESFRHDPPPDGVKIVASSRSHRIPGDPALYEKFELAAFSREETKKYLRTRLPDASGVEIRVAQARSRGNPRILEYLVESDRDLLDPSKVDEEIKLDQLIQSRIDAALSNAFDQGYERNDTDSFLAGLAVLPLPVPAEEYANSQGIEEEAVKSFASDMYPLLEITEQGLMFRDEPTETLIIKKYGSSKESLKRVAENLLNHQERSVYAASALPELLYGIGNGDSLFDLAFNEQFPEEKTGTIGRHNIRHARLKAALRHEADRKNYDRLIHLLPEMAASTSANQRGAEYILDYPDLVIAAKDIDAVRQLFEVRTNQWQGTRDARLTIANILHGDLNEACVHAEISEEWINYWYSQPEEEHRLGLRREGPKHLDIAAISFIWIAEGDLRNAARFMHRWKDWYSYEVWEHVFDFSSQANLLKTGADLGNQLAENIAGLTAKLSFVETDKASNEKLIRKLSEACGRVDELEFNIYQGLSLQRKRRYNFAEGLCKAGGIALSLELRTEALSILRLASKAHPGMWSFFRDRHFKQNIVLLDVVLFLFRVALTAAAEGKELREKDILPEDLMPFCEDIKGELKGVEFRNRLMERINEFAEGESGGPSSKDARVMRERLWEARQFIDTRLDPLLALVKALSRLLGTGEGEADGPFMDILSAWAKAEETSEPHGIENFSCFFQALGFRIATFALWTRSDLKEVSVKAYIKRLNSRKLVGASMLIEAVGILAKRPLLQALAGEEALKACSLIEDEDDVLNRISYFYADLARAILPASTKEATQYFRKGLEKTDAVGDQGDYWFVHDMLLFASSPEEELEAKDFHNLTNICELNIPDEPEKFYWTVFVEGLSRVAGCRGLVKLFRWDDRSKAPVSCTLQPYLTALIRDGKIDPEDALSLNRLAYPVELGYYDTGELAKIVEEGSHENTKELVCEVIRQFRENRQGTLMYGPTDALASVAESVLGAKSKPAAYLAQSRRHFKQVFHAQNEHRNYRGERDEHSSGQYAETQNRKKEIDEFISRAEADDIQSLEKAIDDLMRIGNFRDFDEKFFGKIREEMPYEKRPDYIRMLAGHETLNFYRKLDELKECRDSWEGSSLSLADTYKEIGVPTLLQHMEDIVSDGPFQIRYLDRISEFSGIPIHDLALELVKKFTGREAHTTREIWISLAYFVAGKARKKENLKALTRLLNGPVTKLSHKASDGEWKEHLYPENSNDIFSGMVWRTLGSPNPEYRWRAAHSVRCFARFKRWHILDALVGEMNRKDAGAFQASERPFYYLHAKLWLLIALARVALDEPEAVARYKDILLKIALDEENPHVLMAHFAEEAIRACAPRAGKTELPDGLEKSLTPTSKKTGMNVDNLHDGEQKKDSRPESEFFLGNRFYEHEVRFLGKMFGKSEREVREIMSEIVRSIDPEVKSKNDAEKKTQEQPWYSIDGSTHMSFDTYGQYLGWHAFFMAAGRLLMEHPVTDNRGDLWNEWLRLFLLTRRDGLWVSDGMDRAPLGALQILLEKSDQGLVLTGNESKILKLANLESGVREEVVVAGEWQSADQVIVQIESALVKPAKVSAVVKQLFEEGPETAWLPNYCGIENEEEYLGGSKDNCEPWIVWPDGDAKLDKDDPLGAVAAIRRPRIARDFSSSLSLKREDPFGRTWKNGQITTRSVAWGHEIKGDYEKPGMGTRLACSKELLKELLSQSGSDLLLLIKLLRYEKGYGSESDIHANKMTIVHIGQTLDVESWDSRS